MYNLFVSGLDQAWHGDPFIIDRNRCVVVGEYTDERVAQQLGALGRREIEHLLELPAIFAYETACRVNPKYGMVREVACRNQKVRIDYELIDLPTFITWEQMLELKFELGLGDWEMNRTHWAVKDIDLRSELIRPHIGIDLPILNEVAEINIENHNFDIGLSFAGEYRGDVAQIAARLAERLGPNRCFYDREYTAQLARPNLDTFLQGIYRRQCSLLVVFFGKEYQTKDWCGIEWRSIREIINDRQDNRVLFVKMADGEVDGIRQFDGYISRDQHTPDQIAEMILERSRLLIM